MVSSIAVYGIEPLVRTETWWYVEENKITRKINTQFEVEKCKARLVGLGNRQVKRTLHNESLSSPTPNYVMSRRMLFEVSGFQPSGYPQHRRPRHDHLVSMHVT